MHKEQNKNGTRSLLKITQLTGNQHPVSTEIYNNNPLPAKRKKTKNLLTLISLPSKTKYVKNKGQIKDFKTFKD